MSTTPTDAERALPISDAEVARAMDAYCDGNEPSCLTAMRKALEGFQAARSLPVDGLDAERLDFILDNLAWVQQSDLDHPRPRYECVTQDEDENYIVLSGERKSYATKREAIDAAIAKQQDPS